MLEISTFKRENPTKIGFQPEMGVSQTQIGILRSKSDDSRRSKADLSSKTMDHRDLTRKHLGFGPKNMGFTRIKYVKFVRANWRFQHRK